LVIKIKMTKKNEKPIEEKVEPEENTELSNLENQLKRALADYQNLEKRIASEKSSWILASNKNLLLRLLPGLDSLLLAEKHTQEAEGVKKIETVGRTFDPNLMEAITTQEGEEGKILEEVRAGYMLYDSVLRPAQVIVGKSATS
jgi:molecular chaperone GrpE